MPSKIWAALGIFGKKFFVFSALFLLLMFSSHLISGPKNEIASSFRQNHEVFSGFNPDYPSPLIPSTNIEPAFDFTLFKAFNHRLRPPNSLASPQIWDTL